mmetsp:Transcript_64517/g.178892  ORF Transcript_64517/g.178892 Transcript_64517/m.178892 type:complete len:340 (+) Transcript_64517:204-1223(+)
MGRILSRAAARPCAAQPGASRPRSVIFVATGLPGHGPVDAPCSSRRGVSDRWRSPVILPVMPWPLGGFCSGVSPVIFLETGGSRRGVSERSPVTLPPLGEAPSGGRATCRSQPVTFAATTTGLSSEQARSLTLPETSGPGHAGLARVTASMPWSRRPACSPSLCVLMRTASLCTLRADMIMVTRRPKSGEACLGEACTFAHRGTKDDGLDEALRALFLGASAWCLQKALPTAEKWTGKSECKAPDHARTSPSLARCNVILRPLQLRMNPPRTISMLPTSQCAMRFRGKWPPTAFAAESQESRRSWNRTAYRMTTRPLSLKPSTPQCIGGSCRDESQLLT